MGAEPHRVGGDVEYAIEGGQGIGETMAHPADPRARDRKRPESSEIMRVALIDAVEKAHGSPGPVSGRNLSAADAC